MYLNASNITVISKELFWRINFHGRRATSTWKLLLLIFDFKAVGSVHVQNVYNWNRKQCMTLWNRGWLKKKITYLKVLQRLLGEFLQQQNSIIPKTVLLNLTFSVDMHQQRHTTFTFHLRLHLLDFRAIYNCFFFDFFINITLD